VIWTDFFWAWQFFLVKYICWRLTKKKNVHGTYIFFIYETEEYVVPSKK